MASFKTRTLMQMLWTKIAGSRKVIWGMTSEKAESLVFVTGLIEATDD